jgi:hypothetical protein
MAGLYGNKNAPSYSAVKMGFLKNCPLSGKNHVSRKEF